VRKLGTASPSRGNGASALPASAPASTATAALARVLADPTFELIPLRNALDQAAHLPSGATVSVTASPAKGLEATVALSLELARQGLRVVPHLSARMTRDRAHLRDFLEPLRAAGIDRLFVVGGDPSEPGEFDDALSVLRAIAELDLLPAEVGIGCYPQGHQDIPDAALLRALADKAPFATSMTSQLCFDPRATRDWLAARRAEGIALPLKIGIPGVAEIPKLLTISARIGVRDAGKFVRKNLRFVGELLTSGGNYRPSSLLRDLAPTIADPAANVVGLHIFTFNNVGPTEAWRRELLGKLAAD
jgi:methylenetetrahydrofolate reductase (NADPH)